MLSTLLVHLFMLVGTAVCVNGQNGLFLVDTNSNTVLYHLKSIANGTTYTFLPNTKLTIQANTDDTVTSFKFKFLQKSRLESTKPFTMNGDWYSINGTYFTTDYISTAGSKIVSCEEYTGPTLTKSYSVSFTIAFSATAPVVQPAPKPTNAPRKVPVYVPPPTQAPVKPVPVPVPVPTRAPIHIPVPVVAPVTAPIKVISPITAHPIASSAPIASKLSSGKWFVTGRYNVTSDTPEVCFVMVGRVAVLIGGRGPKKPYIYNPITRTWKYGSYPPGQIALHHIQCVAVDNKVWIVSAWTGDYPREPTVPHVYVYDPFADTWTTKTANPIARRRGAAAAVAIGKLIYVAFGNQGGHETGNHSTALTYLDTYDTVTDTWTALPNGRYARDHTGAAVVNGKICVGGGRDGGTIAGRKNGIIFYPQIKPTECYDPITKQWSIEQDVLLSREESAYGTTCEGNGLLMAGGENTGKTGIGATKQFDVFDGTNWTRLADLNVPRYGSGLAVDCICNAIYVANPLGNPQELVVETFFFGGKDVPCTK